MSTKKVSAKKVVRGKRYTAEEKNNIIAFVNEHNAKNKRGGQLTAAKKFGISQITIASWLKKSGAKASVKAAKATKATKAAKKSKGKAKAVSTAGSLQKKLSSLLSLSNEIEKLESALKAKRAQFAAAKASL